MKIILNIAEKPSVAREIVNFLSGGESRRSNGTTQYNPIFEFSYKINGEDVLMRVTSVQGHVMNLEFKEPFNKWNTVSPEELFEAPVYKYVPHDKLDIAKNIQNAAQGINSLAL